MAEWVTKRAWWVMAVDCLSYVQDLARLAQRFWPHIYDGKYWDAARRISD